MKQSIDLNTFIHNLKRSFYVVCILAMTMGIPVLSYIELTHVEREENTKTVKEETVAKHTRTVAIPKSFKI